MQITYQKAKQGTASYNQDVVGSKGNTLWVIDGATDLFHLNHLGVDDDVQYAVRLLSEALFEVGDLELPLQEVLLDAVKRTRHELDKLNKQLDQVLPYTLPTFAIAMARVHDDHLEYYFLGDCYLIIEGQAIMTDERLAKFSQEIQASQAVAKDDLFVHLRKHLNQSKGYWIGSFDALGIEHGLSGQLAIESKQKFALMSDGFYEFGKILEIDWLTFNFTNQEIEKVYNAINEQTAHEMLKTYNKIDDASVIVGQIP